ncbi:MAG: alpha/beta fold hydrolase, partial [Alphaproteobacteria bacterium]|nr:alpha/beta fold hydrolase [Alphaproteobacteria bacterium]
MRKTALKSGFLPTTDGHAVHWATYGNPAGAPLLLVHGGFDHVFDLNRLTGIDFKNNHIIVLHRRGMGLSTPRGALENNDLAANVTDMERLRTHLNIPQWSIFSWSAGAVLMAAYAARHPDRCTTLTAYAPYLGSAEDYEVIKYKDSA